MFLLLFFYSHVLPIVDAVVKWHPFKLILKIRFIVYRNGTFMLILYTANLLCSFFKYLVNICFSIYSVYVADCINEVF